MWEEGAAAREDEEDERDVLVGGEGDREEGEVEEENLRCCSMLRK